MLKDDRDNPTPIPELDTAAVTMSDSGRQQCCAAAMLNLMLLTKRHLKRLYQLSDSKCQTFDPSDVSRVPERQVARLGDGLFLDTQPLWAMPSMLTDTTTSKKPTREEKQNKSCNPATASGGQTTVFTAMERPVIAYAWLRTLFGEDEEASDYNFLTTVGGKSSITRETSTKSSSKRRRPSTSSEGKSRDGKKPKTSGRGR